MVGQGPALLERAAIGVGQFFGCCGLSRGSIRSQYTANSSRPSPLSSSAEVIGGFDEAIFFGVAGRVVKTDHS